MGQVVTSPNTWRQNDRPTGLVNHRRLDRTQNGTLWSFIPVSLPNTSQSLGLLFRSTDNGTTWTQVTVAYSFGGASNYTPAGAFFIDADDYAHILYKNHANGYLNYLRGTPNAGRTDFTWTGENPIWQNNANVYEMDLVVHRDATNNGGWAAHFVFSDYSGTTLRVWYTRFMISSTGSISVPSNANNNNIYGVGISSGPLIASPKIEFRHNGDGKTAQLVGGNAQPDVFVAWSGSNGGAGIMFEKFTYGAGTWTYGPVTSIAASLHVSDPGNGVWLDCQYDGTRVIVGGNLQPTAGGSRVNYLADRDVADTTTTVRLSESTNPVSFGGMTYDSFGNVYWIGSGSTTFRLKKWTRATQVVTFVDLAQTFAAPWVSLRRGPVSNGFDWLASTTDSGGTNYAVTSYRYQLNQNPTAAALVSPADNASWNSEVANNVVFTHNDPDGDAASSYRIRYRPAGTTAAYQYLTGTTTAANGANVTVAVAAGTWVGVIEWAAQTYDPSNAEGAWSTTRVVTALPATQTGATGGQGGTSLPAQRLYNLAQAERGLRALALV